VDRNCTARPRVPTAVLVGFLPLERAGLSLLLDEDGFPDTVAVSDLASVLLETGQISIVLIDLDPDAARTRAGADSLRRSIGAFRRQHPVTRVVGVHGSGWVRDQRPELDVGLDAVVAAGADIQVLRMAIHGPYVHVPANSHERPVAIALTVRESEVFALIASGRTSRAIAGSLGISAHTVESHKQRVFRRLGVQSQAQAVAIAVRLGLLGAKGRVGEPGS
jgi:DNA-binding CsgD family transcriptional regulator